MTKNESGFGLVLLLVILLAVGAVGTTGWFIYANQQTKTTNKTAATTTKQVSQNSSEQKPADIAPSAQEEASPYVHTVDITLQTEADSSKLPEYTPASFRTYMLEKLKNNKSWDSGTDANGSPVILTDNYIVLKISPVNIFGGSVPVSKNGEGYAGGVPKLWVLNLQGSWDEVSLNGWVLCTTENGGKVYQEFAAECYTSDDSTSKLIKNPNGSISSLQQ